MSYTKDHRSHFKIAPLLYMAKNVRTKLQKAESYKKWGEKTPVIYLSIVHHS